MCEPYHSITQYPPEDNGGNPLDQKVEAIATKKSWLKRILGWFHLSMVGRGHSESLRESRMSHVMLPEPNLFEGRWWDRTISVDRWSSEMLTTIPSSYTTWNDLVSSRHPGLIATEAIEAAEEYSRRVCYGSLHSLRKFLEASLKSTDRPAVYVARFVEDVLTAKGRLEFFKKVKKFFGETPYQFLQHARFNEGGIEQSRIDLMLGFTRKRELLIPAWADDGTLWKGETNG